MSLKTDYNIQLGAFTTLPTEIKCIDALIKTLQNNYPCVKAKKVHGQRASFNAGANSFCRELCDSFLILRYKDHYRYSFIQNKRHFNYQGLDKFSIDSGQHYFLVHKPIFTYKNKTYSLLRNAIYDTVTAYSVFYKDKTGMCDFDFASANSCICLKGNIGCPCKKGKTCTATHTHQIKSSQKTHKEVEYISLQNAIEIEQYLYFGEVIYNDDIRMGQLRQLIEDCGGKEFLSLLEMENIDKSFVSDYQYNCGSIELKIKNIVAVDLRNYNR